MEEPVRIECRDVRAAACRYDVGSRNSVSYTHLDVYKRQPETAYLVDKEAFDNKLDELGALDAIEACGMYVDLSLIHISDCLDERMYDWNDARMEYCTQAVRNV